MKNILVRDTMVPLSEYATVGQDATLHEAILSLEEAQASFEANRYRHLSVLVLDDNEHVVGRLSQLDIIKALEHDYTRQMGDANLSRFGIDDSYVKCFLEEHEFWNRPLGELCAEAGARPVSDVMYTPTEKEHIEAESTLQEAVHRLVIDQHHSLLVNEGTRIIGVFRLADLFTLVCRTMEVEFGAPTGS